MSNRIDEGGLDLCDSIVVTIFCVAADNLPFEDIAYLRCQSFVLGEVNLQEYDAYNCDLL